MRISRVYVLDLKGYLDVLINKWLIVLNVSCPLMLVRYMLKYFLYITAVEYLHFLLKSEQMNKLTKTMVQKCP